MSRRRTIQAIEQSVYVTISELVQLTGMRYSTLKYYTEEGLIPFQQEESRLTRRYNRVKAIERINQIKYLKEKGLSVIQLKQHFKVEYGQEENNR